MKQPLAFRMRPETTKGLLGQSHLLGPGKVITKCLDAGRLFSMIFYGQPGTGKTTMAMCLANELNLPYRLFNAVTGNKKDLEALFQESKLSNGLVVIIDEIHRLNKDKQDLLLPHVENGNITLIGATTSNPYFAINPAIRSRCHLFEIKPLTTEDIILALHRAIESEKGLNGTVTIDLDAAKIIAEHSGGDLRYALNVLEICAIACDLPTPGAPCRMMFFLVRIRLTRVSYSSSCIYTSARKSAALYGGYSMTRSSSSVSSSPIKSEQSCST